MDISALKNAVNNEVLKSKLWADAKTLVDQVAGLDQYKTELEAGIEKLKSEHERLDASADAVRQSNIDASASARKILDEANKAHDAHIQAGRAKAAQMVMDATDKVSAVMASISAHNERAEAAKKAADEYSVKSAVECAKLDELKAHKAAIVKSLTE